MSGLITLENEYKIDFEPEKHIYTINGPGHNNAQVTSWTSVLGILDKSSALLPWAVKCAITYIEQNEDRMQVEPELVLQEAKKEWRNIKDEAADIGSEVHGIIEKYIKHGLDTVGELRDEVQNGFLAFLEWEKETGVKWLASELRVYNPLCGVAGTFDAFGEIKGKVYLIDFKSSKGFYETFPMQLAGYLSSLKFYDIPFNVANTAVLRLDKTTGEPEWKDYSIDMPRAVQQVELMAQLFYMLKKRRLKNNPFVKANFG